MSITKSRLVKHANKIRYWLLKISYDTQFWDLSETSSDDMLTLLFSLIFNLLIIACTSSVVDCSWLRSFPLKFLTGLFTLVKSRKGKHGLVMHGKISLESWPKTKANKVWKLGPRGRSRWLLCYPSAGFCSWGLPLAWVAFTCRLGRLGSVVNFTWAGFTLYMSGELKLPNGVWSSTLWVVEAVAVVLDPAFQPVVALWPGNTQLGQVKT